MLRFERLAYLLVGGALLLRAEDPALHLRPQAEAQDPATAGDTPQAWPPVGRNGRPITDNARLRVAAMKQWWGEWSPEFRAFLGRAAASERGRFAALMPRSAGELQVAAPATGTWSNIGPTKADIIKNGSSSLAKTDSGRPRTILVDPANPQVIYLCTAGGGVWKTTNGGSAWTPITETLGSLSCGFLAMDPADSRILYLGLGDPFDGTGLGVVKSTDGGETWGSAQSLGTSSSIKSILVNPSNRNILLVSTNKGLFRSTDAGASFAQVAGINATYDCWDLAHAGGSTFVLTAETDPANADGATAGRVFRSTDDGATWALATGVNTAATRISVAAAPSNPSTLYAMAAAVSSATDLLGVYKSTDGGATWAAVASPSASFLGGQGFYNHMILIDRLNPSIVYLGGQLSLVKSTNGGGSWATMTDWLAQNGKPYVHADFHCGAQDPNGTLYVGTDGGIFKSTDAGTTWSDTLNIGVTTHLIYSVGSSAAAPDAVIGGFQDNGTRVRSGATATYNQYLGGDGFGSLMHPVNAGTMLGSLYYTRIYKSTNGGTLFGSASSGITESNNSSAAPFITRLAEGPADATGNTVYTFSNTKVYKSTNFAGAWTALGTSGLPTTSLYIRNVGAARSNPEVVGLVANGGRVFLTANGGGTWTTPAALPNHGSYTSAIAFDPADHNTVYVSSVAPDGTKNHLWKSSNFGGSWTAIDAGGFPTGVPVGIVKVDPGDRNVVYAGTHLGLYRSADGGATWARWGDGLPLVNVTDIYVAPDGGTVRLATYGRGFWELKAPVVPTAPSITTHPLSTSVTVGQGATFTVAAKGTEPMTYQWFKNGASIDGADTPSYTTPAATASDNGATFHATVANGLGTATSSPAVLTVNPAPTSTTEVEPNNSIASPNLLGEAITKVTGTISRLTDPDYFALTVGAGRTLTVNLAGPTGKKYNYNLSLSNSAGSVLTQSLGSTSTERLSWTNPGSAPATVVLRVYSVKGYSATSAYTVTLAR